MDAHFVLAARGDMRRGKQRFEREKVLEQRDGYDDRRGDRKDDTAVNELPILEILLSADLSFSFA